MVRRIATVLGLVVGVALAAGVRGDVPPWPGNNNNNANANANSNRNGNSNANANANANTNTGLAIPATPVGTSGGCSAGGVAPALALLGASAAATLLLRRRRG